MVVGCLRIVHEIHIFGVSTLSRPASAGIDLVTQLSISLCPSWAPPANQHISSHRIVDFVVSIVSRLPQNMIWSCNRRFRCVFCTPTVWVHLEHTVGAQAPRGGFASIRCVVMKPHFFTTTTPQGSIRNSRKTES